MNYGLIFDLWIREVVKKCHIFKIALQGKFCKVQIVDLDLGHDLSGHTHTQY